MYITNELLKELERPKLLVNLGNTLNRHGIALSIQPFVATGSPGPSF